MNTIALALHKVYAKPSAWILSVSLSVSVLFIYYLIFSQTTTWTRFTTTDLPIYVWSQVLLSIANAVLISIAVVLFLAVFEIKQKTNQATLLTAGSFLFSAAATGCPVCGAFLLPFFGISASLAALPLGGIEVKLMSLAVLIYAISEYSKAFTGACPVSKEKLFTVTNGMPRIHVTKKTLSQQKPLFILIAFILVVYSLPTLPKSWRINFQNYATATNQMNIPTQINGSTIQKAINPEKGYAIKASYGNLGPELIQSGVINIDKMKSVFQQANEPLTQEQLDILTKGSDKPIRMTAANAHFILDLFWAVGLTNKSPILTQGAIMQYGQSQLGNFASTGGWTLGDQDAMQYYASKTLIPLTAQQERLVAEVAANIYRPCCGNSAAFPDCNHGMAMLGILELMAANGATADDMYKAAKYFNAYWFPNEYFQLAVYFKQTQGLDYKDIDPKLLLSKNYSSVFGIQPIQQWFQKNEPYLIPPKDTVGCGV